MSLKWLKLKHRQSTIFGETWYIAVKQEVAGKRMRVALELEAVHHCTLAQLCLNNTQREKGEPLRGCLRVDCPQPGSFNRPATAGERNCKLVQLAKVRRVYWEL